MKSWEKTGNMENLEINFMRSPNRQNYAKEFLRTLKPRQKVRRVFNASQWALDIATSQAVNLTKKGALIGAEIGLAASVFGSAANFVRADIPMAIALSSTGVISVKVLNNKDVVNSEIEEDEKWL
ncbi:MAG: hypothetical protein F6J89_15975 [Symploca sp. SIO1C4]|uniref:Uncharacterized protein n=1 Tax=Symploca sp. SIO1C4 TaxID=2607765 RepID=A0A6B3NDV7_9CYAN|nr:hypothetical protein [Symploca sp. SIO1C4]